MDELVEKVIYTSAEFLSYILVCITLTLTLTHTHKKSASCTPGAGAGNRCNRCKMVKSFLFAKFLQGMSWHSRIPSGPIVPLG